jgi:GNAT superfamily N-acetyltransferase
VAAPEDDGLQIRPPTPDEVDAMAAVQVRAWQAAYQGLMPQPYLDTLDAADRAAMWRQVLAAPPPASVLLAAFTAGGCAGFTAFGPVRDPSWGAGGELHALNVDPDHWGSGVGSALLRTVHAGLADAGHRRAVLWVATGNDRARRFYARHSWQAEPVERTEVTFGAVVQVTRYGRELP